MKGIVFNLLEEVVTKEYGADTWDRLLDAAGLDGAYTSLGSYPDAQVGALVKCASEALGLPPQAILQWFGQRAILLLADRYPGFFAGHTSTRSFLLTLNDIIHAEVRKIYPGAEVPEFRFGLEGADGLDIEYISARRLCGLARGMIEGSAGIFGETAAIEETACTSTGAPSCVFRVEFARMTRAA